MKMNIYISLSSIMISTKPIYMKSHTNRPVYECVSNSGISDALETRRKVLTIPTS